MPPGFVRHPSRSPVTGPFIQFTALKPPIFQVETSTLCQRCQSSRFGPCCPLGLLVGEAAWLGAFPGEFEGLGPPGGS